jgi:hypothetical protein
MTVDQLVRESCEAQGVPLHVEDPEVLARVAAVVRSGGDAATQNEPRPAA